MVAALLSNCGFIDTTKNQAASTGFEPMTSAKLQYLCSTNWAMKPISLGSRSIVQLGGRIHSVFRLYPGLQTYTSFIEQYVSANIAATFRLGLKQ